MAHQRGHQPYHADNCIAYLPSATDVDHDADDAKAAKVFATLERALASRGLSLDDLVGPTSYEPGNEPLTMPCPPNAGHELSL